MPTKTECCRVRSARSTIASSRSRPCWPTLRSAPKIVAHFAANPRDATQPDATTVAETLADAHESIRWRRAYYSDDNYIWSEMPGKIASEAIKDRLRWIFAEPAKLIETFEAEKASEQRRLARAEQRRQHDDDDDKTPVVVASTPAPTGGDDTPDTPPGGGEALTPVPEPEGPFGPGDDPFGPRRRARRRLRSGRRARRRLRSGRRVRCRGRGRLRVRRLTRVADASRATPILAERAGSPPRVFFLLRNCETLFAPSSGIG